MRFFHVESRGKKLLKLNESGVKRKKARTYVHDFLCAIGKGNSEKSLFLKVILKLIFRNVLLKLID